MKTLILKKMVVFFTLSMLSGCGVTSKIKSVLPDKKNAYKKSESLPDLEIPPDLTADAINDSMAIPDETSVTASGYRPGRPDSVMFNTGVTDTNEQWLSLVGSTEALWPKLREFLESRNYPIELDDAELGVMETGWSSRDSQTGAANRYRYKIFSEPGGNPNVTVLFISHKKQTKFNDAVNWVDQDRDIDVERRFVSDINQFLTRGQQPLSAQSVAPGSARTDNQIPQTPEKERPEIVDIGDDKLYLAIPEEFTLAWRNTERALQNAGLQVSSKDLTKGLYFINYVNAASEGKGLFSKLAFWKDADPEVTQYQLSLTGVGDKTELIVLDEKGEWETDFDAPQILGLIQSQYPVN